MIDISLSIQPTTNPDIIKLEFTKALVKGSYEFKNIDEAKNSPLAQQLFYLPFVKTVYISSNFIALKRYNIVEWAEVQEEVGQMVLNYLKSGKDLIINELQKKSIPINIYSESTPNPSVMKFVANKQLVPNVLEYKHIEDANEAPMAKALFKFPYVKEVFFDENYISITKIETEDWLNITMELRNFIRQYLAEGHIVISASELKKQQKKEQKREDYIITTDITSQKISSILNEYIKPAVASDGGNIEFISYSPETHQVEVILQGACSGCPSSALTLKSGIEVLLKEKLDNQHIRVKALNG